MTTRKRTTILLIEDSPSDTRLITESLRDAPHDRFTVVTTSTLAEGLRKLERDNVDAVLLDLALPDSDGIATFHAVRKQKSSVPVVVLTTTDDDALGLQMVHQGVQDYLPKTVLAQETSTTALTHAIRYAIERKCTEEQMVALNERLQIANEELDILNQELTLDVKERSFELQEANEELRTSNEELRHEVEQRTAAERKAEARAYNNAVLNKIIHVLNKASDLPTLYERTLITTIEQLGFDSGLIATADDDERFTVRYAHNYPPEFVDEINHLDVNSNQYTRALYQQQQLIVMDEALPDSVSFHHEMRGAMVLVPFLSEGRVVGHLALHSTTSRLFTPDDRALFRAIGLEFGTAVARLKAKTQAEEYARQQGILTKVITAGNKASELKTACAAILDTALDLLPLHCGGVFLRDGDTVALRYSYSYSDAQLAVAQRIPMTQRLIAPVMAGTSLFIDDYQAETSPEFKEANKDVASMSIVPLVAGGEVIGFYSLASRGQQHHFTDDERALLTAIGQQAGTVIARLQAEERVRQSEARLNKLIEQSFDAVFIHSGGIIRFANEMTAHILKAARPEDLVGLDALAFPTDEFRPLVTKRIKLIYETRAKTEPEEMQFKALDGSVVDVESMATDTVWEGKPAVYVVFRDITEKKRAEKELKRYSEQLEDLVEERTAQLKDAERLAAIGQTATMIGHDLRNPLQALQLTVDLGHTLFDGLPPEVKASMNSPKVERLFSSVEQQIQYMDKIVADLQDYARPLTLRLEAVPLAAFISDTLALLTIPESVRVNVSETDSVTARVDPHLMQRALSNLIMNAVQAMPHGGELTISAIREDHTITINIHDTGEGVPENIKEALFSPLTTGKAKGTGLGLAVVKRIVEAHNGTIEFASEEGKGTTFVVTLPQRAE